MIRAGQVTYVLDERALQQLATGPNGPIAKRLAREGAKIEGTAKQLVSGELLRVQTGRLRASTTWKLFQRGNKIGVAVGSGVRYSVFQHEGTRYITPRPYLAEAARRNGYPVR